MRSIFALFLALPLLAQTPGTAITPKEKIALFNGKDLDGWYTWLQESKYQDPKHVFTVKDGAIRVSGEEWGGLTTKNMYRDSTSSSNGNGAARTVEREKAGPETAESLCTVLARMARMMASGCNRSNRK